MKQERIQLAVLILRWIARISSLVITFVFGVFFICEFDYSTFFSLELLEYVLLAFIPVCYILGVAAALKHELIGGILMVLAFVLLSEITKAWLLYLGLIFLFMVMYAPGGIASLIMMNLRVAAFGKLRQLWVSYLGLAVTGALVFVGAGAMVEMVYHLQLASTMGSEVRFLGIPLDSQGVNSWVGAVMTLITGLGLFELARREFRRQWGEIQAHIEKEIKHRETA